MEELVHCFGSPLFMKKERFFSKKPPKYKQKVHESQGNSRVGTGADPTT